MKKHILILFLLMTVLYSCSSDDEGVANSQIQINPPSWIQGTWFLEGSEIESGYKFTSNDFIIINLNIESSQRQQLKLFSGVDSDVEVSALDSSSENSYSITLNFPGTSFNYTFDRISDTEIQSTTIGVTAIYVKQ